MKVIFILAIWVLLFFTLFRDAYLVYYKPKDFIKNFRNRRHQQLRLFPFLEKFVSYPDENYVLRSSKVMLPISIFIIVGILIFVIIQILIGIR
jgi:hypothetical protein